MSASPSSSSLLFDANAVITLIDQANYDALFGEQTIELMFYETTNAIWKMAAHHQVISRETGAKMVNQIDSLRTEMGVSSFTLPNEQVYETAWNLGLSAYDCAYVVTALNRDLDLVTDDQGIIDHAPDELTVIQPSEL